jgi:glutamine amidotransferase/cyclase
VKRIVVALDVRTNDHGDLVVTKGDQYDVRENHKEGVTSGRGGVRNLGKPVSLAARYYKEGADEIAFLNITSFRQGVVEDMPMLQVLEEASKSIFVPLTVGGGIRGYSDPVSGQTWSALEVASRYFRAGADKVRTVSLSSNFRSDLHSRRAHVGQYWERFCICSRVVCC